MPPLSVQSLVENAVKHGISNRTGKGTVSIRATVDAGDLLIEVEDRSDGPPRAFGSGLPLRGAVNSMVMRRSFASRGGQFSADLGGSSAWTSPTA